MNRSDPWQGTGAPGGGDRRDYGEGDVKVEDLRLDGAKAGMSKVWNVAVIGGGVLGCAITRALVLKSHLDDIVLLEKENELALHTSGRNSGVIHSGFHLKPGSLKAKLCVEGSQRIADYCIERGIPYQKVGKLVIAANEAECDLLPELERRAKANGLSEARIVDERELREIEPHARGLAGFYSPTDGIIDSRRFVQALAQDAANAGADIKLGHHVAAVYEKDNHLYLKTNKGALQAKLVVNCAGVHADRVARFFGVGTEYIIVPFRGEYYRLLSEKRRLVRALIYPMINPELPFLGVHFTRTVDGEVLIGPNAVLALGRETYINTQIHWGETASILTSPNFIRLISNRNFLRIAVKELKTSFSKRIFVRQAQRLVPGIKLGDFTKGRAGIRAQLVDRRGRLVKDFVISYTDHSIHILNAVSPGLTSALAFADYVVGQLVERGYIAPEVVAYGEGK